MKLMDIDKKRYRKHLNWVFAGIAVALTAIAIGTSTILIGLFSTPEKSNFWLNLAGVVIALALVVALLQKLRPHPFMREVVYVWELKQVLNRIYRREHKLEAAVEAGDLDALIIMNFFYRGSKQLYELDNNLVTIDELVDKIRYHDKRLAEAGLTTDTDTFDPAMLNNSN
jgi:4-amino-4-deoxy-L-arabinose transferase-like glycosyltransferase